MHIKLALSFRSVASIAIPSWAPLEHRFIAMQFDAIARHSMLEGMNAGVDMDRHSKSILKGRNDGFGDLSAGFAMGHIEPRQVPQA